MKKKKKKHVFIIVGWNKQQEEVASKKFAFNNWFLHDLTIEFTAEIAFIILVHLPFG